MDNRSDYLNASSDNKSQVRFEISLDSSTLTSTTASVVKVNMLHNLDLLDLIFSYLVEYSIEEDSIFWNNSSRSNLRNLLHVGLTCKAFFEPAMNQLWAEMDSLLPLLLVIPSVTKISGVYTTTGIVKAVDLYRLEFYASRIRLIQLPPFMEKVSTHIYMAISEAFHGKALFPALTSVCISSLKDVSNVNFLFLHLIAPSPLSTIVIHEVTKASGIHLASFIHDIFCLHHAGSTNPHPLSVLYLEGRIQSPATSLIQNFTRLVKLAFTLSVHARHSLKDLLEISCSLPSLLELGLELPNDKSEQLGSTLSPKSKLYTFPTLRNLHVAGPASHVCDILGSIHGEFLFEIKFTILSPAIATADDIPKCIQRCTTMTPGLLHLHIDLPLLSIEMRDDMFATFQSYRLLRSLHVNSLALKHRHFLDIFDKGYGEWPVLETLTFEFDSTDLDEDDRSYLDTLVYKIIPIHLPAISCPKLRKLETYLGHPFAEGADNDSLQDLIRYSERTNHNLAELKIVLFEPDELSPSKETIMEAKEAILLSRVIDHLFPNLERVDISSDFAKYDSSEWDPWHRGVERMVMNFQEARGGCAAKGVNIHHITRNHTAGH